MEMDEELENFLRERKARLSEDKARLEHLQDPPYMEMKTRPRGYESTVKENIPPHSVAPGKEVSCTAVLPLGVEYERKKQRLQHELRMDYRRYMAQKKHFDVGPFIPLENRKSVQQLLEEQAVVLSKQRTSTQRDAATLTEDRGPGRTLRLDAETSPRARRYRNRSRRRANEESEEDDDDDEYSEELELMEGRRTEAEAAYPKRRSHKAEDRETREDPVGFAREVRRLRNGIRNEDIEFTTGLLIGAPDTEEALRRKKERYRQELQEQIAEQHRNRKREKDLELKVAATGANDPEKRPDRIRQFGLSRRKNPQVSQPLVTGASESPPRILIHQDRAGFGGGAAPPPDQPQVAFHSPLLGYGSALGLAGGLSPNSHHAAPHFHRAMDTPRIPVFPPHPPSTLSEPYRNMYAEPQYCCGPRNLLDPSMAYCAHLCVPGAGLPVPCWNAPPGGAAPSHYSAHSPNSQYSGSSVPEPHIQSSHEAPAVDTRRFPPERSRSARDRIQSYRDALKEQGASRRGSIELYQIQERQERKRLEQVEKERDEAKLEADMKKHQPWGRGGGGAPLRDSTGNLIADLHRMHKQNEEAYVNPGQRQKKAAAAAAMTDRQPPAAPPDPNERVSAFAHVQTSQFARGNVFPKQPTQQQLHEQDEYKAFLKQQIEEKMLKKAEEREQARLEEEKEERRLAEQRARIQREYEEEQERKKQKETEQKAILIQQAEERRKEVERKRKEAEEKEEEELRKEEEELRKRQEKERQAAEEEVVREPSPPVPTLQNKRSPHQTTPRPPTVDSQRSIAPLSERSLSGLQSPPVPARSTQLRASGDHGDLFNELSALRRQLLTEQKRLESRQHQQSDWEELDSPLSDRPRERHPVDVFDMARLRLQAPVRRPTSRNLGPKNLLRIHDSLQLRYSDERSRSGSSEVPRLEEEEEEEGGQTSRRRTDFRETFQQLGSQRSTAQDDYPDLSPTHENDYLRNAMRRTGRGSLLESESEFIDPLGNTFPVPSTPERQETPQLSARERRRHARHSQLYQEEVASSQYQHGRPDKHTGPTIPSNTVSPPRFTLHHVNTKPPAETLAPDPWLWPETSDMLNSLGRPSRREWPARIGAGSCGRNGAAVSDC